ncbi:MAG: hypothetical protein ACP5P4_05895 [Steroidobacteraceae bacterium]
MRRAAHAQQAEQTLKSFTWSYGAYAAAFCLSALAVFPVINRWQDLPALARRIHAATQHEPFALLNPDETTVAMLDRSLRTRFTRLDVPALAAAAAVQHWFRTQGLEARVLVLLPGHAPGPFTPLLNAVGAARPPGDGVGGRLQRAAIARIVSRYDLPQGRRYALLGPPAELPMPK